MVVEARRTSITTTTLSRSSSSSRWFGVKKTVTCTVILRLTHPVCGESHCDSRKTRTFQGECQTLPLSRWVSPASNSIFPRVELLFSLSKQSRATLQGDRSHPHRLSLRPPQRR